MMSPKQQETVVAKGKIFELVQEVQPDGRVFEVARRAPGVRLIIADTTKRQILLTREFRRELAAHDFRLPGGKVFNTLDEYAAHRESGDDILEAAKEQAKVEAVEESGIDIADLRLFKKSALGATVEWDLYVFEAINWQPHKDGQQLKDDEPQDIVGVDFYGYETVKNMILSGEMQEERIALILLQWIYKQEKETGHEV